MLQKDHRLNKSKDIKQTSLRGRSFFNPFFVVKYRKAVLPAPRFAFIVSTKVSKKAVERNRIKRVIREQIRILFPRFQSGDYVIIVKTKAAGVVAPELRESIVQLCHSTRLVLPEK